MSGRGGVGVVWFRRDLRLADNPALTAALRAHERVVPVFVWDPRLVGPAGAPRLAFLQACLDELAADLDGALVVRLGDPATVLPELVEEAGAGAVWCAEDFGPYGVRRDASVAAALARRGTPLRAVGSPFAVAPGTLSTAQGGGYQVFTPFRRAWRAHGWDGPLHRPRLAGRVVVGLPSQALPDRPAPDARLPAAGERAAWRRAVAFLDSAARGYDDRRDRPDVEGTSRLSAALHFGCIHPRQLLDRLDPSDPGHRTFESELCWREFYADVLFHRPESARLAYRSEWRTFRADTGAEADRRFEAWTEGRTGYPVVDAGMRQLAGEAWMHNRVRMIVASFLVKDLHLDWTRGARWFMSRLVDGDLASNQHGWQWVAGTGTDAAPYFRVFNPVAQGLRFDPEGDYVRRWVPELAHLPGAEIHEPWRHGSSLFAAGDYPAPIVDHAAEREEALARYQVHRAARGR